MTRTTSRCSRNRGAPSVVCWWSPSSCSSFFADGRGTKPGDVERPLVWTRLEKQPFVDEFKRVCTSAWERKHRLITTSSLPTVKDVGVRFDLQTSIEGFDADDHWEITVTKVDDREISSITCFTGN